MAQNNDDIQIKINTVLNKEGFRQLFEESKKIKAKLSDVVSSSGSKDPYKELQNKLKDTANFSKGLSERLKFRSQEIQDQWKDELAHGKAIAKEELAREKRSKQYGQSQARQRKFQDTAFKDITKVLKGVDKQIEAQKKKFPSWALSLMFAGMAVQRAATSLMTWGVKAYDDVSHSIIGTITANDRLQGAMLYLGYTVGQAFQPILEMLIPWIEGITTLVSEHEGLISTVTLIAAVFAGMMMATGGLTLALNGLRQFRDILTNGTMQGAIREIKTGIGAIAIGYSFVAAYDAYDDFKKGKVLDGIKDGIASAMIGTGGFMMVANPIAGGALIAMGLTLKFIDTEMFRQIVTVLKVMLDMILILGAAIVDTVLAPFKMIYNIVAAINNLNKNNPKMGLMNLQSTTDSAYKKMMDDAASYFDTSSTTTASGKNMSGSYDYKTINNKDNSQTVVINMKDTVIQADTSGELLRKLRGY